jgi:hypothetical protein
MSSSISHTIKQRENANDVFITPLELAKTHIDMCGGTADDIWYDPFKNSGSYYNQFPAESAGKEWSEILEGKDFFEYEGKPTIICSNPPYSMIDRVLEKSVSLKPRVISYLLGIGNLTARRMEMMEKAGYKIKALHMCKVFKWYGMSVCVVWDNTIEKSIFSFDRTVWK